jgi:DNA-directed RNA polymerase subunit N (RpoN/RPB10)
MYPFIRCCTCNNSLGEYVELFELLKNHLYDIELKKLYSDTNYNSAQIEINDFINIKLSDIFELFKIERYCCRRILITNVNFDSLIYSSINN